MAGFEVVDGWGRGKEGEKMRIKMQSDMKET